MITEGWSLFKQKDDGHQDSWKDDLFKTNPMNNNIIIWPQLFSGLFSVVRAHFEI